MDGCEGNKGNGVKLTALAVPYCAYPADRLPRSATEPLWSHLGLEREVLRDFKR